MTLREKLIVLRDRAGLSQMELADRLGVSRQAVSRWESGDTTPSVDKLKSLAKIYGVSLDWLCSDAADRELPEAAKPEADRPPDDAPAGKEGEKKQKIRAIAIALAIGALAFACVWFAAENKKADEADDQGDNVKYDVVEMPDPNENGFDFITPPDIEAIPEAKTEFDRIIQEISQSYEKIADILTKTHTAELVSEGLDEKSAVSKAKKLACEDARFLLPNACETKIVFTMNARTLLNFFKHRHCKRAQRLCCACRL